MGESKEVLKKEYVYSAVNQELIHKFQTKNDLEEHQKNEVPKIGVRHLQVFLFFFLGFLAFGCRVTLSVGIVAMTDPKTTNNPDIPTYPEWKDKNVILSAFFWGYMIPQAFAGWASSRFGAKWFLIVTFGIQSILGLLIPYTAAQFGSKGVMISRALQGFCQGFIYPSLTHLLSNWAPKEERSRLGGVVYAAGPCGTVVSMLLTGLIAGSWYGWPWVFYSYGVMCIMWCILMAFIGYDSPALHPSISSAEKYYIEESLGHIEEKIVQKTPWKAILTSGPVWALFVTQFGNNFCFWTLLTQIPSYMNSVMNFNIKDNSLLSSLPYLALWILSFFVGFTSDYVINNNLLSITTSRKVFNSLGLFVPAVTLVLLGFTRADQATQAVILLIVAVGSNSAVFSGWSVNHIDLSPNHAGTLMGLCNGLSQSSGVIAPLIVQLVVKEETDPLQWRTVFLITAAINVVTATVYDIFGSAEVQPWNDENDGDDNKEKC